MSAYSIIRAAALCIPIMGATAAGAATVSLDSVSGAWSSITPSDTVAASGIGTSHIQWGTPRNDQDRQSGYRFASTAEGKLRQDREFAVGTFTHDNFAIATLPDPSAIVSAVLDLTLHFTIDGVAKAMTNSYVFDHWETYNQARPTCANGNANGSGVNANGCADRVTMQSNAAMSESFLVNGTKYLFEITGFRDAAGGTPTFWTTESLANSARIMGMFTTSPAPAPVPLPAAGVLLLAGLGGMAVVGRRRKKV